MSHLTRADVEILNDAHPTAVPWLSQWLIRIAGQHYIISAWNRQFRGFLGEERSETVAFYAEPDGGVPQDAPDIFDVTFVPDHDHEACITALLAHLNGEPAPLVERPEPTAKPAPVVSRVPGKSVSDELLEKAANDSALDDDTFTVLARAIEGRPLFDE